MADILAELTERSNKTIPYLALPSRQGPRWLIPCSHRELVNLWPAYRWRARALQFAVRKNLVTRPFLLGLNRDALEYLCTTLGFESQTPVIGLGTPGAYRKATIVDWDRSGLPIAVAKIAQTSDAEAFIHNEARVLSNLADLPRIATCVPRILRTLSWQGHSAVVLSWLRGDRDRGRFGQLHLEWLSRVYEETATSVPWERCLLRKRAVEALQKDTGFAPPEVISRLNAALNALDKRLSGMVIRTTLAHRDFAPWNIVLRSNGIGVVDWEMAETGQIPLYDVFHYHAAQTFLLGRHLSACAETLRVISGWRWQPTQPVKCLYLAYLLDQTLYYLQAQKVAPGVGSPAALTWLYGELERVAEEANR